MPAKALAVARYYLRLAEHEEEPCPLTALHIQKLIYYAQGWSLALRGKPMFNEPIEAWSYGPVVRAVYNHFRAYSRNPIPFDEASKEGLTQEQMNFIRTVWRTYKQHSALSLSDMTHRELPWKKTRGNLSREASCDREIPHKLMREYFSSLMEHAQK